ncbi:MAG: iron-sulfur cluster carrier protein ApbC [Methylococcales bacterium]|nr:iron-sulfur cluster carrier protein ApbC [Methylococcales bacterium]
MSELTQASIEQHLSQNIDPNTGLDWLSGQSIKQIRVDSGRVDVVLEVGYPAKLQQTELSRQITEHLLTLPGVAQAEVTVHSRIVAHAVQQNLQPLPGVKNIIAVGSGKGGVGKSTTAVNIALALAAEGAATGILDADIYGPSIPTMLGQSGLPDTEDGKTMHPKMSFGLQTNSIGYLVDQQQAMIWRGPMVTGALLQLLQQTKWQGLDYLVVDLPPGTGDIQLTLSQKIPVSGAVIVTTPQDIALLDAQRGVEMFAKVNVPVLGIVENMSVHICSQCGHQEPIFGTGGGERMAQQHQVPLLGRLPLALSIREQADSGKPTVVASPDSAEAAIYRQIARQAAARLALTARDFSSRFPKIVVQNA